MTIEIVIKHSDKPDKKYMAIIDDRKTIHFGQKGASDMTQHKSEDRKNRYILRHQKNEDWNNIYTAGFWSRWILWNKPSISESIRDTNNRLKNINIKNKII